MKSIDSRAYKLVALTGVCWLMATSFACRGEMSQNNIDETPGEQEEPDGPILTPDDPDKQPLPDSTEAGVDADRPSPYMDGEECMPDEEFFKEEVFDDVMEHWCVGCHSEHGIARGSRLVLEAVLPTDISDGPIQRTDAELQGIYARNFENVRALAADTSQGVSMLLLKPTNRIAHVGGEMLDIDGEDYRALATFVARVNGEAGECSMPATYECDQENPWPGHGRVRRLSHVEYDRTASDLLGAPVTAGQSFAADIEVLGYLNNADALRASPILVEQWLNTAEVLADSYIPELGQKLGCAARADRACAREFIESFGGRAFRRPLTEKDIGRYLGLFDQTSRHLGFEEGIRDVLTAMLVSPYFLYRFELGTVDEQTGVCVLGSYEIASELSYLIWGTMPDDELMRAARAGELSDPAAINAQASRMLADDRGVESFREFVFTWLHLDRFESVVRDMETYPEFDNDIRGKMLAEAQDYVDDAYNGGAGSLRDLFGAKTRRLDAQLASYYGLPAGAVPEDGNTHEIELADDRAGVLGLGALLATHAGGDRSSPVARGALVRERLLCQELPPPPPALDVNEGVLDPNWTTRERFSQHSTDASCAGCHRLIDPIGFAMEGYDGVGRWRTTYEGGGAPVDTSGAVWASDHSDATLGGLKDLTDTLVQNPDLSECFIEQAVVYGYGVGDTFEHGCNVEVVEQRFVQGDMSFQEMILGMVDTPHFRTRAPAHWSSQDWYSDERPMAPEMEPDPDPLPESEPEPEPEPEPGPQVPGMPEISTNDPSLVVTGGVTNDWGAGYCAEMDVENTGGGTLTWEVTMTVDGTINNNWESDITASSGVVVFTGKPYNATLMMGQKAHFGFCAQR